MKTYRQTQGATMRRFERSNPWVWQILNIFCQTHGAIMRRFWAQQPMGPTKQSHTERVNRRARQNVSFLVYRFSSHRNSECSCMWVSRLALTHSNMLRRFILDSSPPPAAVNFVKVHIQWRHIKISRRNVQKVASYHVNDTPTGDKQTIPITAWDDVHVVRT